MSNLRVVSKEWDQTTECSLSGRKEVIPRAGAALLVSGAAGVLVPDKLGVGMVVDNEEAEEAAVAETDRWPHSVVKVVESLSSEAWDEEVEGNESGASCLDVVESRLSACGENRPSSGLFRSSPMNLLSARPFQPLF
jgi:hypothetical protein